MKAKSGQTMTDTSKIKYMCIIQISKANAFNSTKNHLIFCYLFQNKTWHESMKISAQGQGETNNSGSE